jgi:methylenetetrahydrofolate dehydrogenase (NADP+) / methenyltetrahydrofolate cyclohydrolase
MITLFGKPVAESIQKSVQQRADLFFKKHRRKPKLVVVLVGNDPASQIYTRKKGEAALQLGFDHETLHLLQTASPSEVRLHIEKLNNDPTVDGILIQRPLPTAFSENEVVFWVHPEKDVDAFHPINTGKLALGLPCLQPCTPTGIMALLSYYKISPAGKLVSVIGRSSIVGRPMGSLLLRADATVFQCHSKTPHLKEITNQSDIVIVAAGKMALVDDSYLKSGAVVVDVGMHRNSQNKVVGDVDFEKAQNKVSAITPVPGGVGPMTIAVLMKNTMDAAEMRVGAA